MTRCALILLILSTAAFPAPTDDLRRDVRDAEAKRLEKTQDLAEMMLSLGNLDEARKLYREALALRPDDTGILATLLEVERRLGDDAAQLPLYDRLLAVRPGDVALRVARGECLWRLGRTKDAMTAWSDLLARFPANEALARDLTEVYVDIGRLDDAAELLQHRCRRFGEDVDLLLDEARLRLAKDAPIEALPFLMRAAVFETDDDRMRESAVSMLLAVARQTSQTGEVEAFLRGRIAADDAALAERLMMLADEAAGRRDFVEAIRLGEEGLRLIADPKARDELASKIETWRQSER